MTREAKVGLLVGLAFIIVVGILLEDYNRLETQPSPWTTAADTLRNGAATPHNGSTQNEIVPPPTVSAPSRPIPTRDEVREETKIAIGPGSGPSFNAPGDHPPVRAVPANPNIGGANGNTSNGAGDESDLQRIAREKGVEVVNVGGAGSAPPTPPTVNGARQYVAVPGDTLSKLAGRFLGVNTKTNRDAIVAVNPALKQNPNNIIVGRTYLIPGKSSASPAAPAAPIHVAGAPGGNAPENGAMSWYTVKDNDSLWRIAAEQLGDGAAWIAIRDMNKEVLKGGDSVRKNMRLRLPPKSVATTN
ncbi:MAG TPA: LysM peptidoglycan-binding domain-containing protein [Tepidisphaeraceae bacterium]|jgi:nucleoid-associated protein YgaU|nr:LysM peptidoglycan-binding domain-containing protein [Tepidisphaeraceae bacterium]